jgi:WG containing repeat
LWGYMNNSGKIAVKPQFSEAKDFAEGLAAVEKDDHWQYIDKGGNTVIKNDTSGYRGGFSNGLALVQVNAKK